MKTCSICGKRVPDNAASCDICGSTDFESQAAKNETKEPLVNDRMESFAKRPGTMKVDTNNVSKASATATLTKAESFVETEVESANEIALKEKKLEMNRLMDEIAENEADKDDATKEELKLLKKNGKALKNKQGKLKAEIAKLEKLVEKEQKKNKKISKQPKAVKEKATKSADKHEKAKNEAPRNTENGDFEYAKASEYFFLQVWALIPVIGWVIYLIQLIKTFSGHGNPKLIGFAKYNLIIIAIGLVVGLGISATLCITSLRVFFG